MKNRIVNNSNPITNHLSKEIFLNIFIFTGFMIWVIQFFRQKNTTETFDKLIYLIAIAIGMYYSLKQMTRTKQVYNSSLAFKSFGLVSIIIGIAGLESHESINQDYYQKLWSGFGIQISILTICLAPLIYQVYTWSSLKLFSKAVLAVLSVIIIGFMFIAIFQKDNSIIDLYHSEYVVNEIYAIPAGNMPYVDFIPQYGIFYSLIAGLMAKLFSISISINLILILITAGTVIAILIAIYLVYKSHNRNSLTLAILLVVPFTSITKFPNRTDYPGNIFDLISAVPIRILPGLVIGMILLNLLTASKNIGLWKLCLFGFIIGTSFWLNQDFVLISAFISILYLFLFGDFRKKLFYILGSVLVGLVSYPIVAIQFGNFRFNSIGFFALQYSSGYMAEPIQTPGPVLVILPLIIALFFASTTPLVLEKFKKYVIEPEFRRALITSSFFSCWSLIGFTYYLNRSYASGQMQILFLPLSVASASYFYYLFPKVESIPWRFKDFFKKSIWARTNLKHQLPNLSLAILMALPLASIIAFPNPQLEINRLTNAPSENKWPLPRNQKAFLDIENQLSLINSANIGKIMYFGSSGNYVDLKYGIKNASIFNSPFDLLMSSKMVDIQCNNLKKLKPKYLLVNDAGIAIAQAFPNSTLCGTYFISKESPLRLLVLND
jgi:hypothetical protein